MLVKFKGSSWKISWKIVSMVTQGILNFASDFGIFASENETYWHIFASQVSKVKVDPWFVYAKMFTN